MSFADPQTITVAPAGAVSLPRISVGANTSTYQSGDGNLTLSAASAYGRRTRRTLRLDHRKVVPDPLVTSTNVPVSMSCYMVFDTPVVGYTAAEALAVYTGFKTQFSATSDALITKLLGGES